jgi:3-isopropylmalate/(R)-2-methylmalate dehydratase small subunit
LNGLDEIGLTLENKSVIANFEKSYFSNYPWLKQE